MLKSMLKNTQVLRTFFGSVISLHIFVQLCYEITIRLFELIKFVVLHKAHFVMDSF